MLLQILKEDPDIEDVEGLYRQFIADEELREKYQDRIKAERDRRSQIIYAGRQGEKRGMERGRGEGLEQGIKQGIAQGAIRRQTEIVKRMKARGLFIPEIAELTGLSAEEIQEIE
ncbi:MAG: hypothetical protein ACLFR8_10190 [Alkalispirochaeta sp.]